MSGQPEMLGVDPVLEPDPPPNHALRAQDVPGLIRKRVG